MKGKFSAEKQEIDSYTFDSSQMNDEGSYLTIRRQLKSTTFIQCRLRLTPPAINNVNT